MASGAPTPKMELTRAVSPRFVLVGRMGDPFVRTARTPRRALARVDRDADIARVVIVVVIVAVVIAIARERPPRRCVRRFGLTSVGRAPSEASSRRRTRSMARGRSSEDDHARSPTFARGASVSTSAVASFEEAPDDGELLNGNGKSGSTARGDAAASKGHSMYATALNTATRHGRDWRERFGSFSDAFNDAAQTFGELAGAGWIEENKKIIVKMLFFLAFAVCFYVMMLFVFAHVWIGIAKAIGVRVMYAIFFALALAMAPPIFPNAAAHGLAMILMFAEIALLSVNALLLGLVHLAIVLNKYVLPSWFHRARVVLRESAGGVDHRGRANAHYSEHRQEKLAKLERVKTYEDWCSVANMLDSFPADVGEGGSLWKTDEKSDDVRHGACEGVFKHNEVGSRAR